MQYRKFGKLNWQVSTLALGAAGLPSLKENEAVKVVRAAVDNGINLIDIGYPLGEKTLGTVIKKALADGYRARVKIMTAIPAAGIKTLPELETSLEQLLTLLGEGSVDFLTLGGLNRFTWPRLQELKITKTLDKVLKEKKAPHIGFYFHDQYQFLRDVIQAYDNWTFAKFDYSFMDVDHHPGYGGLKFTADKGLAVIAAKPLLAGRLEHNIPENVARVWANATPKRSPAAVAAAEWALRWVFNHPEISTVVSDIDTVELVKSFSAIVEDALPDSFSVPEELTIGKARDAYLALKPIPCTACRGCMPSGKLCPNGIDVPRIFEIYNDANMYNAIELARSIYSTERHDAAACTECGTCVCGKKIPIPEWLKKANELLGNNQ
jgi:uncharacterized protein